LVTLLDYGPDPDDRHITYYFRKTLVVPDASLYVKLKLLIWRHDGAVVYLNGTEIYRGDMPAGPVDSETQAYPASDAEEKFTFTRAVDPSLLVSGGNVIAVELHKSRGGDNHAGFDLSLVAGRRCGRPEAFPLRRPPRGRRCTSRDEPSVVRGPYLQQQTTDAITLKWRTDFFTNSVVRYGPQPGELTSEVVVSGSRGDHSVRLSGLETDTTYYYSVGTSTAVLVGDDVDYRFRTLPPIGAAGHYRVWITGDSGTPGPNIDAVRDAYQAHVAGEQTNVWLLLGDNAYGSGTDDQYSVSFFTSFSELLRNTVAWPVLGNHDQHSSSLDTQQGPFFDIFDLPAAGEAGGVASQTESHYSFDYGNIHFIGLRSGQTATNTAQRQWLEADLAANEQDWTIVYLHILPYS